MKEFTQQQNISVSQAQLEKLNQLSGMLKTVENHFRNLSLSATCFLEDDSTSGDHNGPDTKGREAVRSSLLIDYQHVYTEYKAILQSEGEKIKAWKKRYVPMLEGGTKAAQTLFDKESEKAERDLAQIFVTLNSRFVEHVSNLPGRFVNPEAIRGNEDFINALPLKFIPTKLDIGRILSIAKKMRQKRRGFRFWNKKTIRILDVGGGSGYLGELVTELARQNKLDIEYVIVDPDAGLISDASQFYAGNPRLRFFADTGEDFNISAWKENTALVRLFSERKSLVTQGEAMRQELLAINEKISINKNGLLPEAIKEYLAVLRRDFKIELPETLAGSPDAFKDTFNHQVCLKTWLWSKNLREQIDSLTLKIEKEIRRMPTKWDLVICSWMPIATDLTRSVREAGGAAVLYALDRYGATGTRSDAVFGEYPERFSEEESFNPGSLYRSRFAWLSRSTPEALHQYGKKEHDEAWEVENPPFGNAFMLQTRKEFPVPSTILSPRFQGISVGDPYAWEEAFSGEQKVVSPALPLSDMNGKIDCFAVFEKIADILTNKKEG